MTRKSLFTLFSLLVIASLALLPAFGMHTGAAEPQTGLDAWYGAWQAGPDLPGTLIGCGEFDGYARNTGVYYPPDDRVYFLGARCESDATVGTVYYFDLPSRTYGVTGATMPVPVSNYQVVTVPDDGAGNGPGFYLIGGRAGDASQTTAVQVYYPDTNTTATIDTDPYDPIGGTRSPGGVVYAGGLIYVFGGFDGTTMFNATHTYDPAAAAGTRWVNTHKNLPSARSYIATVAVGDLIYAFGGDEFLNGGLVPTDDTLLLDLNNLAAGWQDDPLADMPVANGDAPAVYVAEGYLGGDAGGIFVIGGYWPSPGPYPWVYRYDLASNTWESFPELSIPEPATGRRNQAAVYVPSPVQGIAGLGDGQPGLWVFGGFDGSGSNAMTGSSEFFSVTDNPVLLLPDTIEQTSVPGATVLHDFTLLNLSGASDTFDLSYAADVTWDTLLPASLGPLEDGGAAPFSMEVSIPADEPCPATATFTVTAAAQSDPLITDSQVVRVVASCGVGGVVTDATTGEPVENAYVYIQNTADGLDFYADGYTNADGAYLITSLDSGTYYMGASAIYHQPSFYPAGWPEGAVMVEITSTFATAGFELVRSRLEWTPAGFDVTTHPGWQVEETLTLSNTGSGPLYYFFNLLDGAQPEPPEADELPVAGLPRIDPQLLSNLESASDGKADFVVVLGSQAELSGAGAIGDWQQRGEYVYRTLQAHAEMSQKGLRQMLQASGVNYQPLSIINAIIVHGGDLALLNSLAARTDVAQIIANRQIAVEKPLVGEASLPDAVEWNILRVGADLVWSEFGVTGEGIVVAEIDTGTEWDHPALIDAYRGWDGVSADHNYNWYDPYGQSPDEPADANGHGTHVMGTMVGYDGATNQVGVAPGAQWISCKGGDDNSGYLLTDELLMCAEWIIAPTDLQGQNPDPSMRPHVVNNSWGGSQGDYWFTGVIDAWRAAGIFPQFSNGNEGPDCETAGSPGDTWNAFSAGASDETDTIAGFSSRGPSLNFGYLKPDITAPGVDIRSSVPGGGYELYGGTSMASPHVAGSIALLWSANPELIGQIDLSGWILQQSAVPMTTTEGCGGDLPTSVPNNTWGWGLLNIYNAVTVAQSGQVTPSWLSVAPLAGVVEPGESLDVSLTFSASLDMSGLYTATLWLVADDPYNTDLRLPVSLLVTTEPVAGFTSNSPLILGETSVFTNTSTGLDELAYLWDFGDGITSTLESPTHTYTITGTYIVSLTVTSEYGVDSISHEFAVLPPPIYYRYLPLALKE